MEWPFQLTWLAHQGPPTSAQLKAYATIDAHKLQAILHSSNSSIRLPSHLTSKCSVQLSPWLPCAVGQLQQICNTARLNANTS